MRKSSKNMKSDVFFQNTFRTSNGDAEEEPLPPTYDEPDEDPAAKTKLK